MKPDVGHNAVKLQTETKLVDEHDYIDTKHGQTETKIQTDLCSTIVKTDDSPRKTCEDWCCPQLLCRCKGIFYALMSALIFTTSTFIIKQLNVDILDTLITRFLVQTLLCFAFAKFKKYPILIGPPKLIRMQIVRAVCGSLGLVLFYASYLYIPLPDLTTVRYTQVIWTIIFSTIVFRERISCATVIATTFTLLGVLFVAQPTILFRHYSILNNHNKTNEVETPLATRLIDTRFHRIVGFSLAVACAISISFSVVLNKRLIVLKIPPTIILLQFCIMNLILLSIYHIFHRFGLDGYKNRSMFTKSYLLAGLTSLLQLISSTVVQASFKYEHPSIISIVQSSDILFATILQNLFSTEKSNFLVIIGGTLVTTSIFLVGIHKFWQDDNQSSDENQPSRV